MAQLHETELDMGQLIGAIFRKFWLIALIAIVGATATYAVLTFVTPQYSADAKILVAPRESPLTRPRDADVRRSDQQFDESAIRSQVEVLTSREIADSVYGAVGLEQQRERMGASGRPGLIKSLQIMLGLSKPGTNAGSARQAIQSDYFERLTVFPIGESRVIAVEFQTPDPIFSAQIANAVADAYIDIQRAFKLEQANTATLWLEQEITRLRDRLAESEARVERFRAGSDLFGVGENNENLTSQQLRDLNGELARAKAAHSEAAARARLIRSLLDEGGSLEAFQEVLGSSLIQRLQERQVTLRSQIAELSTSLLPGHPRIVALESQSRNLSRQIRAEAIKILKSLETAARVANARVQSLEGSLAEAKTSATSSNQKSIELRALEREANAQKDLLETFLSRYREALARSAADNLPADARIISRAVPPQEPSYPRKGLMTLIASLGLSMLAVVAILIAEFTSGRAFRLIRSRAEMPAPAPVAAPVVAPVVAPPSHRPIYPSPLPAGANENQSQAEPARPSAPALGATPAWMPTAAPDAPLDPGSQPPPAPSQGPPDIIHLPGAAQGTENTHESDLQEVTLEQDVAADPTTDGPPAVHPAKLLSLDTNLGSGFDAQTDDHQDDSRDDAQDTHPDPDDEPAGEPRHGLEPLTAFEDNPGIDRDVVIPAPIEEDAGSPLVSPAVPRALDANEAPGYLPPNAAHDPGHPADFEAGMAPRVYTSPSGNLALAPAFEEAPVAGPEFDEKLDRFFHQAFDPDQIDDSEPEQDEHRDPVEDEEPTSGTPDDAQFDMDTDTASEHLRGALSEAPESQDPDEVFFDADAGAHDEAETETSFADLSAMFADPGARPDFETEPDVEPDTEAETATETETETETEAEAEAEVYPPLDNLPKGTAELANLISGDMIRTALFAGVTGGENSGEIALATARALNQMGSSCVLLDIGMVPAPLLASDGPGLGDLLAGDATFGEVLCGDELTDVDFMPLGSLDKDPPLQRLTLVIGALANTYDKVFIVANATADWPEFVVRPHLAAIVCEPDAAEDIRRDAYADVIDRGAYNAVIIKRSPEPDDPAPKPDDGSPDVDSAHGHHEPDPALA